MWRQTDFFRFFRYVNLRFRRSRRFVDQNPSKPIELSPLDIKIVQVHENFVKYDTQPSTEDQRRKRKNVMEKQVHRLAKKPYRASQISHSSQINDDDQEVDTESTSSLSPNPNDQAMYDGEHFDAMLDEFRDVTKMTAKYEEQLKSLKEQEDNIREELLNKRKGAGNFNETLDQFRKTVVSTCKCEEKLMQLNAQEDAIRVELNNSKK